MNYYKCRNKKRDFHFGNLFLKNCEIRLLNHTDLPAGNAVSSFNLKAVNSISK